MKQITQGIRDYLSKGNIQVANLVALELPSGDGDFVYYTDAPYDLTYAGHVYKTNTVLKVSQPRLTKIPNAFDISVDVPASLTGELDKALNSDSMADRRIIIHKAYVDQGEIVPHFTDGSCLQIFKGTYSEYSASTSTRKDVLTWKYSSSFKGLEKVNGRITDDRTHRAMQTNSSGYEVPTSAAKRMEYMRDTGFQHANKSVSVLAKYQTTETAYRVKQKRSGGLGGLLGGKDVKMEEYQRSVIKEADLRFDLSAKYIPVVYGVQKVGAIPVFADTEKNNPRSVWVVYAICEGEIDGFLDFYLDDKPIINVSPDDENDNALGYKRKNGDTIAGNSKPTKHGERYQLKDDNGEVEFWTFHGKPDQEACQAMVEKAAKGEFKFQADNKKPSSYWDENSRLLDTAYIVARFDITEGRTNIPSFEVEVQGRKVKTYNKKGLESSNKTSTNFAWQTLDYITNSRFGGGISLDDISIPSFVEVANKLDIIDESYDAAWVPFWRYIGWESQDNSNRRIMQGSPLLETATPVNKNIEELVAEFDAAINMCDGKYVLSVESVEEPILHISYGDLVNGKVGIKDSNVKDRKNTIEASIIDPAQGWKSNTVSFFDSDYKKEDKNVPRKLTAKFPSITNYYTARARAERLLRRNRYNKEITITIIDPAEFLRPNHVITLDHPKLGWNKKKFLVKDVTYLPNAQVQIVANEYVASVYINSKQSDISHDQKPVVDESLLPPTDFKYEINWERYSEDIVKKQINGYLKWKASPSSGVAYYTVQRSGKLDVDTVLATGGKEYSLPIVNLKPGQYTFKLRAKDMYGNSSRAVTKVVNVNAVKFLPRVKNLRIKNATGGLSDKGIVFGGGNVSIVWDGLPREYFSDRTPTYRVSIVSNGKWIVSNQEVRETPHFEFRLADNIRLHKKIEGKPGVYRALTIYVRGYDKATGSVSTDATIL